MESRELRLHPNLDQYRKQAKELLKSVRAKDSDAIEQMRRLHPHARELQDPTLADAQLVLARQHSFASWPKFAGYVRELAQANSRYAEFEGAAEAVVNGDAAKLQEMLRKNPELIRARSPREHHATLLHYVSANGVEDYRQKIQRTLSKSRLYCWMPERT